jgi:hypothetical protein
MASAVLRLLENRNSAERLDQSGYLLRLMADDDHGRSWLQRRAGVHNVLDKRSSSRAMKNFRQAGFQPCAFSRSKDDDG